MKKITTTFVLAMALFLSACTNQSNTAAKGTDSTAEKSSAGNTTAGNDSSAGGGLAKDSAEKLTGPAPDTADISFLTKAESGGSLEIQLGELTGKNGKSPRVKAFGEMMIKDHSDANMNLKNVLAQLQVSLPAELLASHEHHKMMLAGKTASEFDKAYMKMMVEDHNQDIADFEKATKSNNPRVKNFASQTLPVFRKHLDSAKAIVAGKLQ